MRTPLACSRRANRTLFLTSRDSTAKLRSGGQTDEVATSSVVRHRPDTAPRPATRMLASGSSHHRRRTLLRTDAVADLATLQRALEERFAYLKTNDVDHEALFAALRE